MRISIYLLLQYCAACAYRRADDVIFKFKLDENIVTKTT